MGCWPSINWYRISLAHPQYVFGWWFGTCFYFSIIYGMSSFPLTFILIIHDGWNHQPGTIVVYIYNTSYIMGISPVSGIYIYIIILVGYNTNDIYIWGIKHVHGVFWCVWGLFELTLGWGWYHWHQKQRSHDELVVKFCIGSMRLDAMAPLDVGLMHMEVS